MFWFCKNQRWEWKGVLCVLRSADISRGIPSPQKGFRKLVLMRTGVIQSITVQELTLSCTPLANNAMRMTSCVLGHGSLGIIIQHWVRASSVATLCHLLPPEPMFSISVLYNLINIEWAPQIYQREYRAPGCISEWLPQHQGDCGVRGKNDNPA